MGFLWLPCRAGTLAMGWKIPRSGRVFVEACAAPLARSARGVSQKTFHIHSPLQQVVAPVQLNAVFERYIGEFRKKLRCSR
jgi:hypothetical protein